MKILLIGNGFDLYHNLPTRYMSFLEFTNVVTSLCYSEESWIKVLSEKPTREIIAKYNLNKVSDDNLKAYVTYLKDENPERKQKLYSLLDDNSWLKYFNKQKRTTGQSWVDFEGEISKVVQSLDKCLKDVNSMISIEGMEYWATISIFDTRKKIMMAPATELLASDVLAMRDRAQNDLDRLIAALEIYLNDYVEKIPVDCVIPELIDAKFDKLLSFNYTSTYERLYGKYNPRIDCEYIHGKANVNDNKVDMVLGIDDYLSEEEADRDTTFIRFKKYFQMLQKRTGAKHKEWLRRINEDKKPSELVVFGHSLNDSDKALLRMFILDEYITTTIYYYSENQYSKILENLVKVIGRDNLLELTGYDNSKIRFIKQKPCQLIK